MKTRITALAAAVAALPLLASAQSATDLQSQVEALLQQVQALQSQLGAQQGGTTAGANTAAQGISGLAQQTGVKVIDSSACPQVGRTLKLASTGDDVSRLQQFLARDRSIYPEGVVSGYYGSLTEAAVKRWQAKFNIVSSGSAEATGYGVVGPRTAAAISLQCSLYAGGAGAGGGTVGGYIQVSPISGNAPLSVNVQATVNTTNSCAGATYLLNWGDNSPVQQIPVAAQQCNQVSQTYSHVYQYGGTYQISLMAGNHRTNATVTVYGPAAPSGYIGTSVSGSVTQTQTQTQTQTALPPESIGANTTSGPSPLTVTFTGVVTSADQGWCTGGCSSQLVFGDGQSASVPLPTTPNTYQNYSITHTYTANGQYVATLYQGQQSSGRTVGSVNITVTQGQSSNASYGPFSVNPSPSNPLSLSASFQLPTQCTGYDLSWGDGSAHITQADGGASCAQTVTTQTFSHLYSTSGTYSISLKRGPTLSVTDSATVSISN